MIIQIHAGQRADKNAVNAFAGQSLAEQRIQPVNAFHNQRLALRQTHGHGGLLPLARFEAEAGRLYLLARQQPGQMLLNAGDVQRVNALQIQGAVGLTGQGITVEVVVVKAQLLRMPPQHL